MGKGMKEKQILVVIKEPGKPARVDPLFSNELPAFQETVGGYIETLTVAENLCIICNEEGLLQGLPFNIEVLGQILHGTIMAVGVNGDEFASIKAMRVPLVLQLLGGGTNG